MDQLDELKRQSQRERDLHCEEASKELNNVKLEMEAKRNDLMARQKQVEAVVTEVLFLVSILQVEILFWLVDLFF